jgi:hypothetical protein
MIDGPMKLGIMAHAWAYDKVVYVSDFHRRQWEEIVPELAPLGYVTKNGFDPALVPEGVTKAPHRVIHISRPERGLRPLLAMWPALKAKVPDARTLPVPLLVDVRRGGLGRGLQALRRRRRDAAAGSRRHRPHGRTREGGALPRDRGLRGDVVPGRRGLRRDVLHRRDRSAGLRHAVRRVVQGRAAGVGAERHPHQGRRRQGRGLPDRRRRRRRGSARRVPAADVRVSEPAEAGPRTRRFLRVSGARGRVGSAGCCRRSATATRRTRSACCGTCCTTTITPRRDRTRGDRRRSRRNRAEAMPRSGIGEALERGRHRSAIA